MRRHRVLSLRPTQIAIGMEEVQAKVRKLEKLRRKPLAKYIRKHPIKVLCAPDEHLYVVDHHHVLAALWLVGVKKVFVEMGDDLTGRSMSTAGFWRFMSQRGCVHLYDQFGDGPREPLYLPQDVRGLADDPYRSLAWMAKQEGAFADSDVPYYEFEWAQLLRRHRLLDRHHRSEIRRALHAAVAVCRSPAASGLPGYRGKWVASDVAIKLRHDVRA
jgi:hypothetical protein